MKLSNEQKDFFQNAITFIIVFVSCLLIASTLFNK